LSEKEERQVNEVAGLYYLYLTAIEKSEWKKASEFIELIVERYGFTPLCDSAMVPISLIEKAKAKIRQTRDIISFEQNSISTTAFLFFPAMCTGSLDEVIAFLLNRIESAKTKEDKDLSLLALADARFSMYFINTPGKELSPAGKLETVNSCLEICRQLSSDNFAPGNIGHLASVYLGALQKPYSMSNRNEGLKFIRQWEKRTDLTARGRMTLYKMAASLLDTSVDMTVSSKEDTILALQYRKKALAIGKEIGSSQIAALTLDLADSYGLAGNKEASDEICRTLFNEHPEYRRNVKLLVRHAELLSDSLRPTEAIKLLESVLKEDEAEGFLNDRERERIRKRIKRDIDYERIFSLKKAILRN
jgi:tetratricopeptide (TPR) repeat protein